MFVTTSDAEQQMPHSDAESGEQFWCAVTLSTSAPWFLFTYSIDCDDMEFEQTTAIAWERMLLPLIQSIRPGARRAITRMQKDVEGERGWFSQSIDGLWEATAKESPSTGPAIYRFCGEDVLRDTYMQVVAPDDTRVTVFAR